MPWVAKHINRHKKYISGWNNKENVVISIISIPMAAILNAILNSAKCTRVLGWHLGPSCSALVVQSYTSWQCRPSTLYMACLFYSFRLQFRTSVSLTSCCPPSCTCGFTEFIVDFYEGCATFCFCLVAATANWVALQTIGLMKWGQLRCG